MELHKFQTDVKRDFHDIAQRSATNQSTMSKKLSLLLTFHVPLVLLTISF